LHFGDRDHADARVLQFVGDDLGEVALDLVGDAEAAGGDVFAVFGHGLLILCVATCTSSR